MANGVNTGIVMRWLGIENYAAALMKQYIYSIVAVMCRQHQLASGGSDGSGRLFIARGRSNLPSAVSPGNNAK